MSGQSWHFSTRETLDSEAIWPATMLFAERDGHLAEAAAFKEE